jgi:hypothetical protein
MAPETERADAPTGRLARHVLFAFILTFVAARVVVFLIMSRRLPNMFLFLRGTHVHHLNYGIFALAAVAGYILFVRPTGKSLDRAALAYGFSMALTFDEFGMWLHLGGSYWQRASVDAVIVVAAFISLIAFASQLRQFEARHIWGFWILLVALVGFGWVLIGVGSEIGHLVGPKLHELEAASSP